MARIVASMIGWFDKHLWASPLAAFLVCEAAILPFQATFPGEILLQSVDKETRGDVYSSLSGSSSGLLGFALAAVAILAVFSPRKTSNRTERIREEDLATARVQVIGTLLTTSFMLLVVLATSTIGIAVDSRSVGNPVISNLVFCCSCAGVLGLFLGGMGMGLSVLEKNRADRAPAVQ